MFTSLRKKGTRVIFLKKESRINIFGIGLCLIALAFPSLAEPHNPIHAMEVSSPRDYAIVMGDTLTGIIRVKTEIGYQLETATLPQRGSAVNDFLEIREIQNDKQALGNETLYRITLIYQVFKGVREAETLTVPALPLRFVRNGQRVETTAPAWNFTLTPIIPANTPDEAVVLRGEMPPPDYLDTSHWRWLSAYLAVLCGLGVYAAWSLGLPPFRRNVQPFVRAATGIKKLGKKSATPEDYRQGAKLLHHALNETAGHTLLSGQLRHFSEAYPEFQDCMPELERFFIDSEKIFYANDDLPHCGFSLSKLEGLCYKLAKAGRKKR